MKRATGLILVVIFCSAFAPPSVDKNNEGVKEFKDEKYEGAFKSFAEALARDPYNPVIHFNLADAFNKSGENAKALTEFESVESSSIASKELKHLAMFNAGNVALEMKDIPKALGYYQKALEYKPDSKETKTNIELALKDPNGGGGSDNKQDQQNSKDNKENKSDKDKQENQDGKGQEQKQNQPNPGPTPKPTPKPFKSQNLNENDVRRILEELKRQEQQIRAKQDKSKKSQEQKIEKDW